MADTTSTGRRDAVTRVRRQHDTIRQLFDVVQGTLPTGRAAAFQPLVRLLAVHETAEEMVVYPALQRIGATGRAVVQARKQEEANAKKALARLEELDAASREFEDGLDEFRSVVEAHATAEEAEVLPLLDAHHSASQLRQMDQWFVLAETIAPTHAHRFAPVSATGNLLLGPAVALVDRTRDVLRDASAMLPRGAGRRR